MSSRLPSAHRCRHASKHDGRTRKSQADVIIQHRRLPHRPRVLELQDRLLLDGEDDAFLPADAYCACTLSDGFEGVVDLSREKTESERVSGAKADEWMRVRAPHLSGASESSVDSLAGSHPPGGRWRGPSRTEGGGETDLEEVAVGAVGRSNRP